MTEQDMKYITSRVETLVQQACDNRVVLNELYTRVCLILAIVVGMVVYKLHEDFIGR